MQYILTAKYIRECEQAYFKSGNQSFAAMKWAAEAVCSVVCARYPNRNIVVVAGKGNNGGDGLVAAQYLMQKGYNVSVYALDAASMQGDAAKALKACSIKVDPISKLRFDNNPVVIDALFGIGLNKALDGDVANIINNINAQELDVVAIDVPSGVEADTGRIAGVAIRAGITVTFIAQKFAHVLLPARDFCGEVITADIGIPLLNEKSIHSCINSPALWYSEFPWPQPSDNKYNRGHTLVVAGGVLKSGAAKLAAKSTLRVGSGLVTIQCAQEDTLAFAAEAHSLMTATEEQWQELLADKRINSVVIGPGTGVNESVHKKVLEILESRKYTVLDADALTVFADKPDKLFSAIKSHCILTPHKGEFERIFPQLANLPKHEAALKASALSKAVIIYKGYDTVIAAPDGSIVVNTNAPATLATAGSGDVLAGLCGGLLAQGMLPFPAACAAVWLQGEAASIFGEGLISEDIVATLPTALHYLKDYAKKEL